MSVPAAANTAIARPFLKWAGGKTQLLEIFSKLYPPALLRGSIQHYYEPFLGSGAVFFDVARRYKPECAFLYDLNEELVLTYRVVQQDAPALAEILRNHGERFLPLNREKRKLYFYHQREVFNINRCNINFNKYSESWIVRAAQLVFLNRTCYNGLYRVNARGDFNTPAGDYAHPVICDAENLQAVSQLLQGACIRKADFSEIAGEVGASSFVYFDPPYRPISKTASFTAYSNKAFSDDSQIQLAALFKHLHHKGASLMLSNSDPRNHDPDDHFFDELYQGFNILRVPARRMINSNTSKRGAIREIVVTNYPVSPGKHPANSGTAASGKVPLI